MNLHSPDLCHVRAVTAFVSLTPDAAGWQSALADAKDYRDFEAALSTLQLPDGGISKPIRTPYGYHILLVRGHRQSDKSEDMMRQQIKRSLYNKAIEDAWQQRLQALRREAYVDIR